MHHTYQCVGPLPFLPPPGLKWGFGTRFDTKILPCYGIFTISKCHPTIWGIWQVFKKSSLHQIPTQVPTLHLEFTWGCDMLDMPHHRAFHILVCQIPTISPYKPKGRWWWGYTLIGALNGWDSFKKLWSGSKLLICKVNHLVSPFESTDSWFSPVKAKDFLKCLHRQCNSLL